MWKTVPRLKGVRRICDKAKQAGRKQNKKSKQCTTITSYKYLHGNNIGEYGLKAMVMAMSFCGVITRRTREGTDLAHGVCLSPTAGL